MRIRLFAVVCLLIGVCAQASPAGAARGLTTGFNFDSVFGVGAAADRDFWLGRAAGDGAGMVRLSVSWAQIAPAVRPVGFDPANPASPGYNWTSTDRALRDLTGHRLQPLLTIVVAPSWAEGANRPAVKAGSWEPSPSQFASFATAAALRYGGHYPDPQRPGSFLPRVRYWQPWNEPNIGSFLNPQWIRSGHRLVAESPILYRRLLNAFYLAVKKVSRSNFVLAAGTAPYGNRPGGYRIAPVAFDRDLFCLRNNAKLTPLRCPDRPLLDAVDDHPYGIFRPTWHAINRDDTATPDFYRIAARGGSGGALAPRAPRRQ